MKNDFIKIMISDDHNIYRQGLILSLKKYFKNVDITPETSHNVNGKNTINLLKNGIKPHYIILDINMEGDNGYVIAEYITKNLPTTKIIFLTMYDDYFNYQKALEFNPMAYLTKNMYLEEFIEALKLIFNGEKVFEVENHLMKVPISSKKNVFNSLSSRDLKIIKLITEGKTNKQIGEILNTSFRTIEKRRIQILKITNTNSTNELVVFASKYLLL